EQKARAELLLHKFEYYEASALSYPKPVSTPTDEASALALLDQSINYQMRTDYAQKRLDLMDEYAGDPVLEHPKGINGEIWSGMNPSAFCALTEYIIKNEAAGGSVREQVEEYGGSEKSAEATYAQLL